VGIPLTEKNIYFYMYWFDKNIYIVYETEPNIWWNVCFEMIWLVSILFKYYQWCLRIDAWVKGVNWFKVFEYVLRLRFKLCKLFENMSCWNCSVFWREYVLNDFKVLDKMLDLFSVKRTWFNNCMIWAWYSSEIYTGQARNIEHVV